MNLLFNTTKEFASALSHRDKAARGEIIGRVNSVAREWIRDKDAFAHYVHQPYAVVLDNGYQSSLYSVEVEPDVYALLTVEDDPIFEQVVVTLLRVVERTQLRETYDTIVAALYQDFNGSVVEEGVLVGAK